MPRPDSRDAVRRVSETAVARIRELAAAGRQDDRIAERLNAEGVATAWGRSWNGHKVGWTRRRNGISPAAVDPTHASPLPDRHPDGRYSMRGAARRFGVGTDAVRRWIVQGHVAASREDFGGYRNVWWIDLNETTVAQLERLIAQRRR